MSKFRRNNICSSPRNRNKSNNDGIGDISTNSKLKLNKSNLMSHGDFLNRIQKSLYYGGGKVKMSVPLSDYIADTFSDTHNGYSLNRLNYSTIGNLRSTPCSLILAMIYLERLRDADPAYTKHVTPTELFLMSMMVATKFYSGHDDDSPYVNWTECVNTTSDNLLQMEIAFLNAIDWKVYVSNEEFFEKVKSLEIKLAQQQGTKRGYYTYLEMSNLMPSDAMQIAKEFILSTLVLGFSYTVLVATMVASVFLASQIPGTYLSQSPKSSTVASNDLSSSNSSSQTSISTNDAILYSSPTELDESVENSSASNLNILLNIALDRHYDTSKSTNKSAWSPLLLSSWYSLLRTNSFKWPVIENTYEPGADVNLYCNSTTNTDLFTIQPNSDRFTFGFNGIKMKWA